MKRARVYAGLQCPTDPAHGPLFEMRDGALYCPHRAHDGRPRRHPGGPSAPTRATFTTAEVTM